MQMAPKHELHVNRRFPRATTMMLMAVAVLLIVWAVAAFLAIQSPPRATTPTSSESLSSAAAVAAVPATAPPDPAVPSATAQAVPADILSPAAEDPPLAAPEPTPAPAPAPAPAPPAAEAVAAEPTPAAPQDPRLGQSVSNVPDSNLYMVVAGDTIGTIAARFGLNVHDVLAANGLGMYSTILPGQTLKLSGPPVAAAAVAPAPPAKPAPAKPGPPAKAAPAKPAPAKPGPPEKAAPAKPAPAKPAPAASAVRTINVAGAGGQAMVDRCIGPIHFTPTNAYSLFITEHDFCGGWARFSGIGVGETVILSGYGTYKATALGQVFRGGTTNDVRAVFGGFPRAVLQTCIPGTNQMLLIALN